ncbi:MAG: XRE family transcriptional regulator [Nanoarchaeota archaeon]|nr:XRE family transcriptional regulator [Nanoarchaeota archaeon]
MFRTPCETALWKTLPSIRKELVKYLVTEKRMERKKVAKILGITESAISQYLKDKRGSIKFTKKQLEEIKKVGDDLVKDNSKDKFAKCMCNLCTCVGVGCK